MKKESGRYAAVIGDIVDSKGIENRGRLQESLAERLEVISARKSGVVSPFTITLGDEFQAVFETGSGLIESLFEIRAILYPVECRFAIGLGRLTTQINRVQAIGMDGPAFHLARESIKSMKGGERRFGLTGEGSHLSVLVDPIVDLLWKSTSKWNGHRLTILTGILAGKREKELAKILGISERSIYKNIKEAQLSTWKELIEGVEQTITEYLKESIECP